MIVINSIANERRISRLTTTQWNINLIACVMQMNRQFTNHLIYRSLFPIFVVFIYRFWFVGLFLFIWCALRNSLFFANESNKVRQPREKIHIIVSYYQYSITFISTDVGHKKQMNKQTYITLHIRMHYYSISRCSWQWLIEAYDY